MISTSKNCTREQNAPRLIDTKKALIIEPKVSPLSDYCSAASQISFSLSSVWRMESFVNSDLTNPSLSPCRRSRKFRRSVQVSVTRQPPTMISTWYAHREIGMRCQEISKANDLGGLKTLTFATVDQASPARELTPLNRAPTCGPDAPSIHLPPSFSGESRPIAGKSVMIAKTFSGALSMSIESE